MRRLVVLRPEPGAGATVAAAKGAGIEAVAMPLFEVQPVAWDTPDPGRFDGLLITSANALRHGGPQLAALRGLAVYAVGKATAALARDAGFAVAAVGDRGIAELLAAVAPKMRLLHLCGEHRVKMPAPRQAITAVPVYRAAEIAVSGIAAVEGAVAAVHSPRAGARLAELAAGAGLDISTIAIAAISRQAARAAGNGWKQVAVAERPEDGALLALAARLCNRSVEP